jgi:hypothetical protein
MKNLVSACIALLSVIVANPALADRVFQASEMYAGPGSTAEGAQGAAWLRRSPSGIHGRVMVKVDNADTAYSVWWIVFNNPGECGGAALEPPQPCGLPDLFNPLVHAAVFNASGAISAASGTGGVINVDLQLKAGEGSFKGHAPFPPFPPEFGLPDINGVLGKKNGCGAEIHIDVNEHLAFDTDWVTELTQPEGETHRFAIFPAVHCKKGMH